MLGWITQFLIIILLYQDFASGFIQQEDGYSHLRKYLRSKRTKLSWLNWPYGNFVETGWIEQPVDHFNSSDNRSWLMKYNQNLQFFKVGGPIYLFIGGEAPLDPSYLNGGLMFELAMETGGAMFASEHRYYGESMPGDNRNLEDLKYLSSTQAIADFVQLLVKLKQDNKFKYSKVVVIGGSYPGTLAARARLLYPQVIDAAVASSAPVLAKLDFYEYLETVGDVYKKYGTPGCYDQIADIFNQLAYVLDTPEGMYWFKRGLNFCVTSDLSRKENQHLLFSNLIYAYSTQGIDDVNIIKSHCQYLQQSFTLNQIHCENIDFERNIQITKGYGDSWLYQTCSEFGFKMTTSSNKQPFGKKITLDNFVEECNLVFGPNFTAQTMEEVVNKTNDFYGGLRPNVTKVIFTNGEIDPWHRLGVLEDLNPEAPARVIPQVSHCRDLHGEYYHPSKEFRETVQFVKKTIKQWIGFVLNPVTLTFAHTELHRPE